MLTMAGYLGTLAVFAGLQDWRWESGFRDATALFSGYFQAVALLDARRLVWRPTAGVPTSVVLFEWTALLAFYSYVVVTKEWGLLVSAALGTVAWLGVPAIVFVLPAVMRRGPRRRR